MGRCDPDKEMLFYEEWIRKRNTSKKLLTCRITICERQVTIYQSINQLVKKTYIEKIGKVNREADQCAAEANLQSS